MTVPLERTSVDWESGRYSFIRWRGSQEQRAHEHTEPRLIFLLEGAFEERVGGATYACSPGTAIYRDAAEWHSERYGEAGAYVSIAVHSGAGEALENAGLSGVHRVVQRPEMLLLANRLATEIRTPDAWSPLAAHGLLLEAAARFGRSREISTDPPHWLRDVLDLLQANPASTWTLERIASAVTLSPAHVARTFRRHVGLGFADYLRRLRLAEARALLVPGTAPVAQIASQTGFCDQSHLNRCFRKAFGTTPARYRRAHKR
jgi:AraC family transcriptional regulator